MQKMRVWSLGQGDPLEEEMATPSSCLAWGIPSTEEPWQATVHGAVNSQTWLISSSSYVKWRRVELQTQHFLKPQSQSSLCCLAASPLGRTPSWTPPRTPPGGLSTSENQACRQWDSLSCLPKPAALPHRPFPDRTPLFPVIQLQKVETILDSCFSLSPSRSSIFDFPFWMFFPVHSCHYNIYPTTHRWILLILQCFDT